MNIPEVFEIVIVLITVSATLIAPTIWFYRHNTSRIEKDNEKIVKKLEESNASAFTEIKDDLRSFRSHFDQQLSEVHRAVESKNREMRDFVAKEIQYVRDQITAIDTKIDQTRERTHEIEKDLLRLQALITKEYVTKSDLERFLPYKQI